ncbi:MAG: Rpn family recombination-promoting nuclease/putative transposase [Pseudomonadota bacterium]
MTSRYLDPKIDLAFKRVFGEHANLLKSFLNALLPLPDDGLIESLEYLAAEQAPEIPGLLKNSIVDVKCKDSQGRTFIVEMQMLWTPSFENRIVFGASQAYVKQLKAGHRYAELQPVYALALLNDVFDRITPEYYHHYKIVNTTNPEETLKGLEFVFIELPKFKPENSAARKMQVLWLRFLSEVGQDNRELDAKMKADAATEADIADALELVEVAAFTEEELNWYQASMDRVRVEWAYREDAEAVGEARGLAKGKAEGIAEGQAQLVRTMSAKGMQAEQISQMTQLPVHVVLQMLSSL